MFTHSEFAVVLQGVEVVHSSISSHRSPFTVYPSSHEHVYEVKSASHVCAHGLGVQ